MNRKRKIFAMVGIQIILIIASFVTLTVIESKEAFLGNSVDIAGKNRFLSSLTQHAADDILIQNKPISELIEAKNQLEENLFLIKDGGKTNGREIPPLDSKFDKDWELIYDYFLVFEKNIEQFIESDNIDERLELISEIDTSGDELIVYSNVLVIKLANEISKISSFLIVLQIIFAAVNIIAHIILIYIIIRILSKESEEKFKVKEEALIQTTKEIEKTLQLDKKLSEFKYALDKSAIVSITDLDGNIMYVNDMFCEISKYSEKELLGKNHRIVKSDFHPKEVYEDLWNTISNGHVWKGILKNKAKDGTFYWVATSIVPLLNPDEEIEQYLAIRQDITKQKLLSDKLKQQEKLSVIGQLSARLAHDLRNPLSIIQVSMGNLKMLYGASDSQQKLFDKVDRSIIRINHQVNDVLNFVKGHKLELNKIKLSKIIEDSIDSLVIPDDIELILPKNDVELLCDPKQMVTVWNNLILNGIQAIDGTGTLEITCNENNDEIIIQIKDSGKGIPKEDMDKIFELMFTTRQNGTGLGLVSVKSIIEAHDGIISVTSPPTIFKITLPKILD